LHATNPPAPAIGVHRRSPTRTVTAAGLHHRRCNHGLANTKRAPAKWWKNLTCGRNDSRLIDQTVSSGGKVIDPLTLQPRRCSPPSRAFTLTGWERRKDV